MIQVTHRGNVIANIVEAALQLAKGFFAVNDVIDLMRAAILTGPQRLRFAEQAYDIRFRRLDAKPSFAPDRLLEARREADQGNDLWSVLNVLQENVPRGGVAFTNGRHRSSSTRGIRAIREDVRINTALWGATMMTLTTL